MNWSDRIRREFVGAKRPIDEGVVEEFAQHAAAAWEAARADGASVEDADAGVYVLIASWCRETSGPRRVQRSPLLESASAASSRFAGLGLDITHALRLLRRQPGFALISIAMIALGIGATTTLFSVVNGVLLKPLPWPTAERLVRVSESRTGGTSLKQPLFTNGTYLAWSNHPSTIDGVGAWNTSVVTTEAADGAERLQGASITASLFPLLGVTPIAGVGLADADELNGHVMLLSFGLAQERFGGARNAIGQTMRLDGQAYTIAGVMPRGFEFPDHDARLWMPFHVTPTTEPGSSQHAISLFNALARLRPGSTPAQASAEAVARGSADPDLGLVGNAVFGSTGAVLVSAVPMIDAIAGDVKPALILLLAAVVLLCGAAIGNVANMQLAHATMRRREVAIRAAIGAGTARLARQLLVETSCVAAAGGASGLALTALLLRALPALLPADFPRREAISIDARVLLFVGGLTLLVSVAIALLPVRLSRRMHLNRALIEDGSAPVGQRWRSPVARSRMVIITSQVAIAAILLVGAALLARSLQALLTIDRGYTTSNLLTARVNVPGRGLPPAQRAAFYASLLDRLQAQPRVTHAGFTNSLPLTSSESMMASTIPPAPGSHAPPQVIRAMQRVVSPDYFAAVGMRLRGGRGFNDQDIQAGEPVMVINQTFARQYLGASAIGSTLPLAIDRNREAIDWRIIGIVDDVRHHDATDPVQPEMFFCATQLAFGAGPTEFLTVRTTGDPTQLAATLLSLVHEGNRSATVDQVMTMDARLMASLSKPRLYAVLLGGFATFALLIAGIGLFGGLSYGVTQRTREISVRAALGATPSNIMRLVVGQGVAMTAWGLAAGFLVANVCLRYLSGFLFGITTHDAASFAIVGVVLTCVALIACAIPARRAARLDPLKGLRS